MLATTPCRNSDLADSRNKAYTPEILHRHRLVGSTADGFQGDERDIILYSFRFGPSSSPGVIRAIEIERERLNVAFSRARRKVISFISQPPDAFPTGLIRSFLEHSVEIQKQAQTRLSLDTLDKFDSTFERVVCEGLRNRGLTVLTQVPCAGFFIDLVAFDNEARRIAIECDGEFHYDDGGDLRPEDHQRQDIIERSPIRCLPQYVLMQEKYLSLFRGVSLSSFKGGEEKDGLLRCACTIIGTLFHARRRI
jgi:very-short-patch-repair endonuclease